MGYLKINEPGKAEPFFAQALDGFRRVKGENDPNTLNVTTNLADAYIAQGKLAEAEPLLQRKLDRERQKPDTPRPQIFDSLRALTKCQLGQKKYADAEKDLREMVEILKQILPDHWLAFEARSLLGESLLGQKKYDEAEKNLLDGYKGLEERSKQIPKEDQDCLSEAGDRLVRLYEEWGKPQEAESWRVKLKK